MKNVAVLDDYDGEISKLSCWRALQVEFNVDFFNAQKTGNELSQYEIIVANRERTMITKEFIDEALSLRHLALTGRLTGQADLQALTEKNISVSFTASSGISPTELTIGLMLASIKRITKNDQNMRQGGWQSGIGEELA